MAKTLFARTAVSACALIGLAACGGGGGGGSTDPTRQDTRTDVVFATTSAANQGAPRTGTLVEPGRFATSQDALTSVPTSGLFTGPVTMFVSEKSAREGNSVTTNSVFRKAVADVSVRFRSATEVVVTVNGVSRVLTDTNDPNFFIYQDGSATLVILVGGEYSFGAFFADSNFDENAEFDDFLPGGVASGNGGVFYNADMILGYQTDPAELAALAGTIVSYEGDAYLIKLRPNRTTVDDVIGTAAFDVDFGTNLVTGSVDLSNSSPQSFNLGGADGDINVTLQNGQVTGDGITGHLDLALEDVGSLSSQPAGAQGVRLDVNGVFYGPDAQELSGTFVEAGIVVTTNGVEEVVPSGDQISGAFLTEKVPPVPAPTP